MATRSRRVRAEVKQKRMKARYGIGERHQFVAALIQQGFTVRKAKQAANAMFDAIAKALQRHESVSTPIGTLQVVEHSVKPFRDWKFILQGAERAGLPIEMYRRRYKVELKEWSFVDWEDAAKSRDQAKIRLRSN